MQFSQNIFKAYDIRGKVGSELTTDFAHALGRALADFLPAGQVVVGYDMRHDSTALATALIDGLIQQRRVVVNIGQVSSDMIYFAIGKYDLAGGAMITASHNPGEYNGIKLTGRGVSPIGEDTGLGQLRDKIVNDEYTKVERPGEMQKRDIMTDWLDHVLGLVGDLPDWTIGVDAGNGMAGPVIERLHSSSPLKIAGLYLTPDGDFPNHPANPLIEANLADLKALILQKKLPLGIAFDGDGDRAFLVDELGNMVSGSTLGALLARELLEANPGATILYSATCSRIVPDTISAFGGKPVKSRVGHSFIKAKMIETGALLAVESSGHFYYADNFHSDSGLLAGLRAVRILAQKNLPVSAQFAPFTRQYVSSGEINSQVADPEALIEQITHDYQDGSQERLDGLSIEYPDWWFNVRSSNTEPVLRLNVESRNPHLLAQKTAELLKLIRG